MEATKRGLKLPSKGKSPRDRHVSFREHVAQVAPRFRWYRHCEVLGDVLQRVADGELKRVMVFEPPRHGKSEEVSRLFSSYYLRRYPERWVGLCSFGSELAHTLSRNAREYCLASGVKLKADAAAVKHWETTAGGGLWAAGVGGPILGKGFHLGIIDDPIKNSKEAMSPTYRTHQRDWYNSAFTTREEPDEHDNPDGAIIVVMQRWNEEDLCGWLLSQEEELGDEAERWHIVSLEAIKRAVPPKIPPTCTLEPDWRKPGEALCPERRPIEKLLRIKKRIGPYFWSALYDQNPTPAEGTLFRRAYFDGKYVEADAVPAGCTVIRYWDKAYTADGGCYTAGVKMALHEETGRVYILHVHKGQWAEHEREAEIRKVAEADGTLVEIFVEQEPAAGKESAQRTVRNLRGYTATADRPVGSKEQRAKPFAAACGNGDVYIVRGTWNLAFVEELVSFPNGSFKDQVDAATGAYAKLTTEESIKFY